MATRTLNVAITGDARSLNRVLDSTEHRTKRWGSGMAKGFAIVGAAAGGALAGGLAKSAKAAIEAEKSQARMVTQLRASGIAYQKHARQIDEVIQKHSKLSGFDDEDLQDSFTNLVRVTGDVDKSLRLTGLAADFARAKHMDVAKAGELVGKVAGGNTGILSRYGITVEKGASAQEALGLLQAKFAGQAEAYGKTTQGALDRASVASENLGEIVGTRITPLLAKGASALVDLVDKAGGLAGPIRTATGAVAEAWQSALGRVRRFLDRHKEDVESVVRFVRNIGANLRDALGGLVDIVSGIWEGDWKKAWGGAKRIVRAAIENVGEVIRLAWDVVGPAMLSLGKLMVRKLGDGLEDVPGIVEGELKKLPPIIKRGWDGSGPAMESLGRFMARRFRRGVEVTAPFLWDVLKDLPSTVERARKGLNEAARDLARGLVRGVIRGADVLGDALRAKVKEEIKDALRNPEDLIPSIRIGKWIADKVGDGIGKTIVGDGLGFLGGSAGASGAGLMGADFDLAPFARIGAGMGLHTTSGLRPGSITSSGNPSYHGTGDAIDMSGPPGAMMRFARTMKGMFGSRLRELIYTPMGAGIKDGRPYRYSGQVAQDHFDHVHVAYTGPFGDGIGKGLGRFSSTAYGPPWGGINGTGVTATGVNLRGAPHQYGVAVDPDVIPLGTRLKISPNPFGYGGYFTAFDTGGAIQGNRIDFYDWRGRASQMKWGSRPVTVWTEDENPLGGGGGGGRSRSRPMSPREAFRQSRSAASLRSAVALRTARRRAGKLPAAGPGKGVDRGGGMGPDEFAAAMAAPAEAAADALADAIAAQTRATEEHTAALRGVQDEMQRHRQIAESTMATDKFQLYKFVADIMSGQLGRGIANRGLTPGAAVEVAF